MEEKTILVEVNPLLVLEKTFFLLQNERVKTGSVADRLWLHAEDCRPILVDPNFKQEDMVPIETLSLPFPYVYIGSSLNSPISGFNVSEDHVPQPTDDYKADGSGVLIWSILLFEESPGKIDSATIWSRPGAHNNPLIHISERGDGMELTYVRQIASYADRLLRRSSLGTERINLRIKSKINGVSEFKKINRIIRICPKGALQPKPLFSSSIDWSHRWEVRGHWRKFEGMGKDRLGHSRTVNGFTWVIPHVKGPEDKILVPKIRVVGDLGLNGG